MTLFLLKVHLQMFLSIPITQKYQILSCDTLVVMNHVVLTLCLCVLYGSRSNLQVLPYTTSPDCFFTTEVVSVYYALRTESLYTKQITFHA
jgi:hypothetical protein